MAKTDGRTAAPQKVPGINSGGRGRQFFDYKGG